MLAFFYLKNIAATVENIIITSITYAIIFCTFLFISVTSYIIIIYFFSFWNIYLFFKYYLLGDNVDKLKSLFKVNKSVFVFLFCLMLVGVVFGSCLPLFLSSDDKVLVSEYLSNFFVQVGSSIDYFSVFKNSFFCNSVFFLLIWLLGISAIGIPIILFLFFYKCFIFGFSISSIIINYGFKGILFSFVYIFPHQVINIFCYLIITSYSLIFSIKLIGLIFKKTELNIKAFFNRYFRVLIVCSVLFILSGLYESFIGTNILKWVYNLIGL